MTKTKEFRRRDEQDKPPYHYTECGLDDIYLRSGYVIQSTPEGDFVSVKDAEELLKAIGIHLVTAKKELTGRELRFLRKHMDETQAELADLLRVSDQTVARWEKGEGEGGDIPGPADFLIRMLFLEHIGAHRGVRKLLRDLKERDEGPSDKQVFRPTKDGWKPIAACG
jgi:DNA-binding transcriptional regulator YiaG